MRFYPKQLHSIQELKREKAALELRRKLTEEDDMFSFGDVIPAMGKKDKDKTSKENKQTGEQDGDGIVEMISGFLDSFEMGDVLKIVGGPIVGLAGKKLRNNVVLPVAKELVGGYLKWKAAELSIKAARHFIKAKKEKKHKEHKDI